MLGKALVAALFVAGGWAACNAPPPVGTDATSGPVASEVVDEVAENAACEACHEDVARTWRQSRHATAFTNDAFTRAFREEPREECAACHAPEGDPHAAVEATKRHDSANERSALGVTCVTCHVAGGAILAAPRDEAVGVASASPHPIVRTNEFGSTAPCARCHEFPFPQGDPTSVEELSQSTIHEYEAARIKESCASCHMPEVGGGAHTFRSHALASVRDPTAWPRAFRVTVKRDSPASVEVAIAVRDAGHALPTGDMLRRLRVRAEALGGDMDVLASNEVFLGRAFSSINGGPCRREVDDNRPRPGRPAIVRLKLPEGRDRTIAVTVSLERVLFGNRDLHYALVDSREPIFQSLLPTKDQP